MVALEEDGSIANYISGGGRTSLHYGAWEGEEEASRALVACSQFPLVNQVDTYGFTALHFAAIRGNLEMCRTIVSNRKFQLIHQRTGDTQS